MIKFCPDCGSELKTEFKFCPSCGYSLQAFNLQQTSEQVEIIECENCGTDNSVDAEVCSGCGTKLKGEAKTVTKLTSVTGSQKRKPYKEQKIKRKELHQAQQKQDKEIDSKKIIGILAAVLGAGFLILLASGVFDKPVSTNVNTNVMQNQEQGSGVDLSALQRINELEEILKTNPDNNEALLELAHLRNDSRMFDMAIVNYREYLSRVPDDPEARIDMGVCYYNLGRYDEAIAEMTKALEYSPNHQIGHLNLGIVNLAAGNVEKSREWLQKTVALGPETDIGKRAQELLISH
jgi:tetratricopeptide (TPR) repeat protein